MSDVRLIAVPYDSGIRGWRMGAGPIHLLESGLEARLRAAGHAVQTQWIEAPADPPPAEIRTTFQLAASVADAVRDSRSAGALPIILSGNCSSSIGTLGGLADAEPAVVWLDAHADFNTPDTTGSGFLDGMSLAIATGRCWMQMAAAIPGFRAIPDSRVLLVGTRDFDPAESAMLRRSEVEVLSPADYLDWLPETLKRLRTSTDAVYLHIDLDVLDPSEGRANAFAADQGLSVREVLYVIQRIRRRFAIAAVALTAYDPSCDPDGRIAWVAGIILDAIAGDA